MVLKLNTYYHCCQKKSIYTAGQKNRAKNRLFWLIIFYEPYIIFFFFWESEVLKTIFNVYRAIQRNVFLNCSKPRTWWFFSNIKNRFWGIPALFYIFLECLLKPGVGGTGQRQKICTLKCLARYWYDFQKLCCV